MTPPDDDTAGPSNVATEYRADPGGHFATDAHRHVLGHLTTPADGYGWPLMTVIARLQPSVQSQHIPAILAELQADGYAEEIGGAWTMTQAGFDKLTGPIANEPPEGATAQGPAMVSTAIPIPRSPGQ